MHGDRGGSGHQRRTSGSGNGAAKAQYDTVPERIKVDNGSEFISKSLDKWAYDNQVTLDFPRPGQPTDNAFIISLF